MITEIMCYRNIAIFFFAIVQSSLCYDDKNGNADPIQEFLQLDADSQHELAEIEELSTLHKRDSHWIPRPDGTRIRIRTMSRDHELWVHPSDSHLADDGIPIYFSEPRKGSPGNVVIRKDPTLMKRIGRIFENRQNLASMVIGRDSYGRTIVNGYVQSTRTVIRSLPDEVVQRYAAHQRSVGGRIPSNSAHHVVYNKRDDRIENHPNYAPKPTWPRNRPSQNGPQFPRVLYPKILVAVDWSMYARQHNRNTYYFFEYILAFVNGIDLKYRSLDSPEVRLYISGILIESEFGGLPYISDRMLEKDVFHAHDAMDNGTKFFYDIRNSIPLESYDIVLSLTEYTFGPRKGSSNTLGLGFVGTTCRNSTADGAMQALAIIQDDSTFYGIHVAAHELGHVFGLQHDARQHTNCLYSNGFIMSFTPWFTSNSTSFSNCSLTTLEAALEQNLYTCMYETPPLRGTFLPRLMPGKIKTLEDQCAKYMGGLPCKSHGEEVNPCVNMYCLDNKGECRETGKAAVAGTQCNDKDERFPRFCIANQCITI